MRDKEHNLVEEMMIFHVASPTVKSLPCNYYLGVKDKAIITHFWDLCGCNAKMGNSSYFLVGGKEQDVEQEMEPYGRRG
jgi:hypothetical protein